MELLRLERMLLVPDSLYAACFPKGIRFFLQCARFSERPILLLMHLEIFAVHVLLGVMVDLAAHCFPSVTIVDVGAGTWVLE